MEDENEQQLDNQDDSNTGAASGGQNDDQDVDTGTQGTEDQGTDDDQGEHQTRQERRRERFEAFNEARNTFDQTASQRNQVLRRDPYAPLKYDKGTEYDVDQLEKDRSQYGDSRYSEGVNQQRFYDQQARFYDRNEIDSEFVANKYPFLDEDSDEFDPDLNTTINELFFEASGFDKKTGIVANTNLRYKPFVQRYVKAMEKYAATRNADSANNLDSQRSRTGIRPSGNSGRKPVPLTWGDPRKMSDTELEAHIKAGL